MDERKYEPRKTKLVPPDGGWGWMVVLGTAMCNAFNQSLVSIYGLMYADKLELLGQGTQGAALVQSTMLLILNFSGPISGPFIKYSSPRLACLIGSISSCVGVILSGYSTEMWHLLVTFGVFVGLGLGFIQSSTFVSINSYFLHSKGRAVGVSAAGTGLGQIVMPHVIRYLLENHAFSGLTLIVGGLCLQGVVGAIFLQPVSAHMKKVAVDTQESERLIQFEDKNRKTRIVRLDSTRSYNQEPSFKKQRRCTDPNIMSFQVVEIDHKSYSSKDVSILNASEFPVQSVNNVIYEKTVHDIHDNTKQPKSRWTQKMLMIFDIDLLSDWRFLNIIIGCALSIISIQNFSLIFPFFLQEEALLTKEQTAMCMSFVAGADLIGRLTMPSISDRFQISARVGLLTMSLYIMVIRQLLAYQTDYVLLLVMSALYGCGRSMIIVTQNLVISEHCKPSQVPNAVGFGMMARGIVVLPLGLFLGWVRDYTGSYIMCTTVQNLMIVVLAVTWLPDMLHGRCKRRKKKSQGEELSIITK